VVVLGFWEVCRQEDFMQLENETVFNEAVIEEKEQGIREIHQQIGEVNEIFKDLAVLVHEQCYMIDDIDKNIVGAEAVTEEASRQLVKADKSQKSGSNIACLILVIVVMVLLILIILLKIL
jgi:syntaxin 7